MTNLILYEFKLSLHSIEFSTSISSTSSFSSSFSLKKNIKMICQSHVVNGKLAVLSNATIVKSSLQGSLSHVYSLRTSSAWQLLEKAVAPLFQISCFVRSCLNVVYVYCIYCKLLLSLLEILQPFSIMPLLTCYFLRFQLRQWKNHCRSSSTLSQCLE